MLSIRRLELGEHASKWRPAVSHYHIHGGAKWDIQHEFSRWEGSAVPTRLYVSSMDLRAEEEIAYYGWVVGIIYM